MDQASLLDFEVAQPPEGESPWVEGFGPGRDLTLVDHDPRWFADFETLGLRIVEALGPAALEVDHVGSTAVPGLPAKAIVDVCMIVADPDDEDAYVPAMEAVGFVLAVREPWWKGHRLFRFGDPRANVHVFGPDATEPVRQQIFRDWLRTHPADRVRYADAKRRRGGRGRSRHGVQRAKAGDPARDPRACDRRVAQTGVTSGANLPATRRAAGENAPLAEKRGVSGAG